MSNVRGKISIDVQFADSTTSAGVQSLKTITLQDVTEYTSGKVAVVTGTVGTAFISVNFAPSPYRNASGDFVSIGTLARVALAASGDAVEYSSLGGLVRAAAGQVSINAFTASIGAQSLVRALSGTASYTLVLYGE